MNLHQGPMVYAMAKHFGSDFFFRPKMSPFDPPTASFGLDVLEKPHQNIFVYLFTENWVIRKPHASTLVFFGQHLKIMVVFI